VAVAPNRRGLWLTIRQDCGQRDNVRTVDQICMGFGYFVNVFLRTICEPRFSKAIANVTEA
jgi:hypothetical protein